MGIVNLVRSLARIPGVDELAMTTDRILLSHYCTDLAKSGLRRVSLCLDTLRPARFR